MIKTTIGELKEAIKRSLREVGSVKGGRGRMDKFDLTVASPRFNDEIHTEQDVIDACLGLFHAVGTDLGMETEDPSDPAFLDYAGDSMSDAGVPSEMIDQVLEKFQSRSWRRRR